MKDNVSQSTKVKGCLAVTAWTLFLFILGIVLMVMGSCKSIQYVPVETVKLDSIYLTKLQKDSVYLKEYVNVYQKADTVYKERIITKYKEKLSTDTLYVTKIDSVQVPMVIEKPLTKTQQRLINMGYAFIGLLAAVILYLALIVYRKLKGK